MTWYSEMLKDPRWQRRRLEILNNADFTCENCGSKEKTLHVHHMFYRRGHKPWEYQDHVYRVLCEDCHELIGDLQAELSEAVCLLGRTELEVLVGIAKAAGLVGQNTVRFRTPTEEMGACLFWGINMAELEAHRDADGWHRATEALGLLVNPRLEKKVADAIDKGSP